MNNRILVIDDDNNVIDTYREILTPSRDEIDQISDELGLSLELQTPPSFDFQLMSATQGEEGVELARMAVEMQQPFTVAFIDMRMPPGWDGLKTARELRKLDDKIHIVIVTAYTDRDIDEIQHGLDHDALLVYKPFTRDELFQMARTLCIGWNDRKEKVEAFQEVERLASYPEENPAPVLRFSEQGELLYHNPPSAPILEILGTEQMGDVLTGAWMKRITEVFQQEQVLEIEVSSGNQFYSFTMVPIASRGYLNLYVKEITRRYLLNRQLTYQARHDSLTGLANRREFIRKLNHALRRTYDHGGEHALLYLDLNRFKEVNDTAGHLAGDRVLRDFSSSLLNEVKDGDILGRIGGDEFALLVYDVGVEQARAVGQRISHAVENHHFIWKDKEFQVGISVGIAMIHPENLSDANAVLHRGDLACFSAKALGDEQNRVYVYHDDRSVEEQKSEELELASRVRSAIQEGTLRLHTQEIRPFGSAEDCACHEVLLRMKLSSGELVSPAEFMPISERFDLMPTLDRWVVEETMRLISKRNDEKGVRSREAWSINLSGMTLAEEGLGLFIRDQLKQTGVDPKQVIFEVSEGVAYLQLTLMQQFIQEMRDLGVRVALDDFGSKDASFTYLQKLPVDLVKIDGRLVRGVIHNKVERTIVESIHRVCAVLNMETIAVSVENEQTDAVLDQMGVHYRQGFHIEKPVPFE